MKQNIIETIIGFVILTIAGWFLVYAYNTNRMNADSDGYILTARFQNAEGIVIGSDIMTAGIKIGEVEDMTLDRDTFFAVMKLKIHKGIQIPKDSQAAVVSSGFLGGKFVAIAPGASDIDLKDKDTITFTQSSVNIESLIGKFMYSYGNNSNSTSENSAMSSPK
jgi:phospholipid/cholesterol/gamma-HCH transport system substrate-binding protein